MVYTDSEGAPKQVEEALEEVAQISTGTTIAKLLSLIDSRLCAPLSHNSGDLSLMGRRKKTAVDGTGADDERTNEADVEIETDSDEEDDSGYEDDVYDLPYNMDHWQATSADPKPTMVRQLLPEAARLLNRRIRSDLRTVRNAGFRYGVLKGMRAESTTCVLCISARISRLGLSGEAIQAWDLHENQYAVLLIKYTSGYKPFDALMKEDPRLHGVEFCVGVCNKYKPGVFDAINAFVTGIRDELSLSSEEAIPTKASQVDQQSDRLQFGTLFVSASLNSFMNRQLVSLVRLRYQHGVDWDEAKGHLNAREGRLGDVTMHDVGADRDKGFVAGLSSESATSAGLTDSDHLLSKSGDLSFPLIAMQFFLRSLVRCTEFCLVCHDKIEETFEALKPYVCNKPLCLYQVCLYSRISAYSH
jgi:ubiquitin-conjugating enzyme E2 Q